MKPDKEEHSVEERREKGGWQIEKRWRKDKTRTRGRKRTDRPEEK